MISRCHVLENTMTDPEVMVWYLGVMQPRMATCLDDYFLDFVKRAEACIQLHPKWAYKYAEEVLKSRWPQAEEVIKTSAEYAYWYTLRVLKSRWPQAEEVIKTSAEYAYWYTLRVLNNPRDTDKTRWLEAESTIMQDGYVAWRYAKHIIQGRWIDAEPVINANETAWRLYCIEFDIPQ